MTNPQNSSSLESRFFKLLAVVIALTLASGTLYGRLTQRWGPSADLVAAADHVRSFPKQLGAWQLVEDSTMPDSTQRTLECAGYVNRTYIHQETGQSIGLAIIVGPPGPTAVHTPEICYSSRSYNIKERPSKIEGDSQDHSFWGVLFQSRAAGAQQMQVYYAWNNGEKWEATDNPRIKFGGQRMLYKIQISGDKGLGIGNELTNPAKKFVDALAKSSWSPATTEFISN